VPVLTLRKMAPGEFAAFWDEAIRASSLHMHKRLAR
jgi:hypothetical protein